VQVAKAAILARCSTIINDSTAAMQNPVPKWVISGQTVGAKIGRLSVVTPIADKLLQCRDCPLCAMNGLMQRNKTSPYSVTSSAVYHF
jgi:hypothetical protein